MSPLLDERGRINTNESRPPRFVMEQLFELSDEDLARERDHFERLSGYYKQLARVAELTQEYIARFGRDDLGSGATPAQGDAATAVVRPDAPHTTADIDGVDSASQRGI